MSFALLDLKIEKSNVNLLIVLRIDASAVIADDIRRAVVAVGAARNALISG